jgi:hypothetical protein
MDEAQAKAPNEARNGRSELADGLKEFREAMDSSFQVLKKSVTDALSEGQTSAAATRKELTDALATFRTGEANPTHRPTVSSWVSSAVLGFGSTKQTSGPSQHRRPRRYRKRRSREKRAVRCMRDFSPAGRRSEGR